MIKNIKSKISLLLVMGLIVMSCTEAIDLDQVNDLVLTPAVEASLVYFDEPASRFIDSGANASTIQDFISVEFFNDQFIADNLEKAEFVFETKNTINRIFELQVDFLDDTGTVRHTIIVNEDAAPDNTDSTTTYIEVFEGSSLTALKQTVTINFSLRLLPGETIDENTPGRIQYISYASFYFNISK
ncbi:hypothetical protein [Algibacter sp. L4_22]|uniref:hypothetical protein n=1 Tax=Algibacter sp. L4_22 TaxID=2942477 RepID=UPI00201B7B9A|nr:hypothetical protein [Algibacter sp. L4_22]MCL5129084.1 hypothetical protein [Algibacter sp. L4_22]